MIILHQYPEAFTLSSLSPFCIKVEFFLKMANIPYKTQPERLPSSGPRGKLPFITDGAIVIPDSSLIIEYLIKKFSLSHFEVQKGKAEMIAFKAMIEESLYFILLYSRWVDENGYKIILKDFVPLFPPMLGLPFLGYIRKNLTKQAHAQGLGRHTAEEVYNQGKNQIQALAEYLGEKQFFFDDKLTIFDATAYSFLSTILRQPIESPLKERLKENKNLMDYITRMDSVMS